MILYMLVTNDEFELPLVTEKKAIDLLKYMNGKTRNALFCNIYRCYSTLTTIFGPAKIRKVEIHPTKSDLRFALAHDLSYLTDNFTAEEIAQTLNVSRRTFFRNAHDHRWLRTKIEAALNF